MNRRERAEYAKALASMKRWAGEGRPEDWTAGEWSGLVEKAFSQKSGTPESARFPLLRPLVSVAAALGVLICGAVFLSRTPPADLSARNTSGPAAVAAPADEYSRPLPETVPPEPTGGSESSLFRPDAPPGARRLLVAAAETLRPKENKPAFTWISPETGLKIVWFTNNNLKLEDLP
ncbi:MAG: hypothetical protein ABSA30_05015 [Candidatus Aminicenantales bacterium]|jgi:hypothetical protein